ncbi:energy-coupling factor transporter transmembrane protein EcfT [Myxococcota bacterium]|nr:energy-coupling factor transporter transmembrane protein EcfT [Myxococcota bacterium]
MMDPRARLLLIVNVGLLAVTLERPMSLALLALAAAAPLTLRPPPARWFVRGGLMALGIVWSTVLSQGLFYAEQPRVALACVGPVCLWREGVLWGLAQSARFLAVSFAGLALTLTTPPDRLLAALVALRVPFGLALMGATALRFVPELGQELLIVRDARAQRGRPVYRRGPVAWLRLELSMLRPVIARAWRRAQSLAESLDTRGFDPLQPRVSRRPLRFTWRDAVIVTPVTALTIGALITRILTLLYTTDTWYHPSLRALYAFARRWL